ncbi:Na(+)/dicarboxylate symporter [Phocicoccus pinnipedialis]|uniref:Na(+)/dicarboxylate symporter n=1 Tax=Phocicoccus pinnipedialis TaxID=110845 RepID=A0A6V7RG87_9BACL|nr:hypothetical protein [Jeotgalicoccus pinnipedialis]CAD2076545.1 hypothetical protein JEOPIN946_01282 [Jeotgalicoccus pinnipedialis]
MTSHTENMQLSVPKLIGLILGPLLFVLTLLFMNASEELSNQAIFVLATTLWIAV